MANVPTNFVNNLIGWPQFEEAQGFSFQVLPPCYECFLWAFSQMDVLKQTNKQAKRFQIFNLNCSNSMTIGLLLRQLTHDLELRMQEALGLVLQVGVGEHRHGKIPISLLVAHVHLHA